MRRMIHSATRGPVPLSYAQSGLWFLNELTAAHATYNMPLALRLAGGRPLHLRPGKPFDLERLDGAVITGGHDVEPVLYRATAEVQPTIAT